jgi:RNA polymerase sigma-70 factor (ECF subfamily)
LTIPVAQTHQSDVDLAAAILARDRKATARLVEMHTDAVYQYVRRRLAPKVDMLDDVVQESFVAAWKSLKTYSGEASLQTWLLGIARYKVEDYYREILRSPLSAMEIEDNAPAVADGVDLDAAMDQFRQAERAATVLSAIPYEYAIVLRWRYWEGRSAREMARASGRTEKAVERMLARARLQFKERWLGDSKGDL